MHHLTHVLDAGSSPASRTCAVWLDSGSRITSGTGPYRVRGRLCTGMTEGVSE